MDSHGSCKTHYKDPVIASAYKPDNRTTGGHVHYMAVHNCISYPVRDYLYHSYIRVWIRAGNRHRDDWNACCGVRTVCAAYHCKLVRCVAGSNKNQIDGRLKGWN